jgi:glucosamine-6-phosphate isomerase
MHFQVFESHEAVSERTAQFVIYLVRQKPNALICVPSGDTPRLAFRRIVEMAQPNDFKQVTFVALDEWVGISPDNVGSCRYIVENELIKGLDLRSEQIHYFDGLANDLAAECRLTNEIIAAHGGLDLMLVGLGMNGHIGLNEPNTPFDTYAHVSELAEVTVSVGQKYFSGQTALTQGITVGLRHLQEAKTVILIATGAKKANIVERVRTETISEKLPASILNQHENSYFWVDSAAVNFITPEYL